MGNKQHCDFAAQAINGLRKMFWYGYRARCCFVKHQNTWALQQSTCDSDALFLPTRQTGTTFTNLSLQPFGSASMV